MVPGDLGAGQERRQLGAVLALSPAGNRLAALLALLIPVLPVISVRERTSPSSHACQARTFSRNIEGDGTLQDIPSIGIRARQISIPPPLRFGMSMDRVSESRRRNDRTAYHLTLCSMNPY